MSYPDVPPAVQRQLSRLRWSEPRKVLYRLETLSSVLMVIGDPDNAAYEWVILDDTGAVVLRHSDAGYGIVGIALRDGLIAVHGLPGQQEAAKHIAEALAMLERINPDAVGEGARMSAALAIGASRAELRRALEIMERRP